jgi:hypothetical protein
LRFCSGVALVGGGGIGEGVGRVCESEEEGLGFVGLLLSWNAVWMSGGDVCRGSGEDV